MVMTGKKWALVGAGILMMAVAGYAGAHFYAKSKVDNMIGKMETSKDAHVRVRYGGFSIQPLTMGVTLSDVNVELGEKGPEVTISFEEVSASRCDSSHAIPYHCKISLRGVTTDQSSGEAKELVAEASKILGSEPKLDLDIGFEYLPQSNHKVSADIELGIRGLGKLNLSALASDLNLQALQPETMAHRKESGVAYAAGKKPNIERELSPVKLHRASIIYTDQGLLPLIIKGMGKQGNKGEDAVKQEFKGMAAFGLMFLGKDETAFAARKKTVDSFIDKPQKLEVIFKPTKPASVVKMVARVQMQGPKGLAGLGLSAKLNGKELSLFDKQSLAH